MKRSFTNLVITSIFILASTILMAQTGPGGVGSSSSIEIWLNGDSVGVANGSPVPSWTDQSGNGNDFTQASGSAQPTFQTGAINGHAAVSFDGSSDYMDSPSISNLDNLNTEMILVADANIVHKGRLMSTSYSSGAGSSSSIFWGAMMLPGGEYMVWDRKNTSGDVIFKKTTASTSAQILESVVYSGSNQLVGYFNNSSTSSVGPLSSNPTGHQFCRIGARSDSPVQFYNGLLGDVIVFNRNLNNGERNIINNHFASKYGISIANDYYAYEGTHPTNVIGVGGVSPNDHTDSRSGGILRLYNPSLPTESYLMVGNDAGALTTTTSGLSSTIKKRLVRTWRGDVTGSISNVSMDFDMTGIHFGNATGSDYVLLIDDDGDFSNGGTTEHFTGLAFNVGTNVLTFTGVNLSDGNYFTVATRADLIASVQSGPWHIASTWNCSCVPISTDDAVIKSGHTVTVRSISNAEINSLEVQSGGILDFFGTATLDIYKDLNIYGDINSGQGKLSFTGSSNHDFDYFGNDTLTLYKLDLNTSSATLTVDTGKILIENNLTVSGTGGTLNKSSATGSELIFSSTSSGTAYMYRLPSGASVTGTQYTFQRFIGSRSYDWIDLGSPASTTLQDWDQRPDASSEIYMSGVGGVDGNACCPIWYSVYTFDVSTAQYVAVTSTSQSLSAGLGFEMWMADGPSPGTLNNFYFDSRGTPYSGQLDVSSVLNKSGAGSWTLLSNPYPATINFKNVSKSGIKNEVWVYDDAASNYILLNSNPVKLQPFQGFYVESTSTTNSLIFNETDKTNVYAGSIYSIDSNLTVKEFSLKFTSDMTGQHSYTYFRLSDDDNAAYDPVYDARLLRGPENKSPKMWMQLGNEEVSLNTFNETDVKFDLMVEAPYAGSYTLTIEDPKETIPENFNCVTLRNKLTGEVYNLLQFGSINVNLGAGQHTFELILNNDEICAETHSSSTIDLVTIDKGGYFQTILPEIDDFSSQSRPTPQVYNSAGQVVPVSYTLNGYQVNVMKGNLGAGIYVLKINHAGQTFTTRMVVAE